MKRRTLLLRALLSSGLLWAWSGLAEETKGAPAAASSSEAKPSLPAFPVEQYTLKNGLTVLLSEDHSLPSVAAHPAVDAGAVCALARQTYGALRT
jgi:hypothetical protein